MIGIGFMRPPSLVMAAFVCALVCAAQPASAQVSDQQVDMAIAELGDDDIEVRDQAHNRLQNWATTGMLTAAQIGRIKAARADPDLERALRAKAIYKAYVLTLPPVVAILDAVRVQTVFQSPTTTFFIFDDAMSGSTPNGNPVYACLLTKYVAVRNALLAGDIVPPAGGGVDAVTAALQALRAFIAGLTAAEFADLNLRMIGGGPATRQQVLDRIDNAINGVGPARDAMAFADGGAQAGPPTLASVSAGTNQQPNTGRTFTCRIASVQVAGHLDLFHALGNETMSRPPSGFVPVGAAYDVLAVGGLRVAGEVTVTLAYNPNTPLGNPPRPGVPLVLARLANGNFHILQSSVDEVNRTITATYLAEPEPEPYSIDQFGEFVILQPISAVPVASTEMLIALAGALLAFGSIFILRRLPA